MAMGVIYPGSAFVGAKFLPIFVFLSHNFGSKYPRKSIKGSMDSDDILDPKKA